MTARYFRSLLLRLLPAAAALVTVATSVAFPAATYASSLSVRPDVFEKADVRVCLDPSERAGLGMLVVDGAVARTVQLAPSVPATLAAVALAPGSHTLRLLTRSSAGISGSPSVIVRSWTTPGPVAVAGLHDGLYPVDTPLTLTVGDSTTRLTAVLGGKTMWTKTVTAGAKVLCTLRLVPGVNTLELTSENPCGATTKKTLPLVRAVWPLPSHSDVGSEFGPRGGRMHKGIDIHAPDGTHVVAAGAGRVLWARPLTTYGGLVMIDHGGKLTSYYAHLSGIDVKYGQVVAAGQKIGRVGSGHLHFQTFLGGLGWDDTKDMYRRVNSGTPTDPRIYVGFP